MGVVAKRAQEATNERVAVGGDVVGHQAAHWRWDEVGGVEVLEVDYDGGECVNL